MKKNIEKGANAMTFGRHAVGIFLFALALLWGAQTWGYQVLNNDRILLMNNDTWLGASKFSVTGQGFADSGWTHDGKGNSSRRDFGVGTNHIFRAADGTQLWHLFDCRPGSAVSLKENYLPTSPTAQASGSVLASACVIMQNLLSSQVFSPYYDNNGIGTIYFDVVNLYGDGVGTANPAIEVQIATNLLEDVSGSIQTELDPKRYDWKPCSFDVLTVKNDVVSLAMSSVTNLSLSAPSKGGASFFYRVRAHLNLRVPVRFRIVRTTIDETRGVGADTAGNILIDNIQVSLPPFAAELYRYGEELDFDLKGKDVLGFLGDVSTPFSAVNQKDVFPRAYFHFFTNCPPAKNIKKPILSNVYFNYRCRYLNQVVPPKWEHVRFLPETISEECELTPEHGISFTNGVGDLEYFFSADFNGMFYQPQDFAYSSAKPVGWGDWTEEIAAVTNRASYTVDDGLPSGGTDYFVRIREGESPYEWVKWHAEVRTDSTTNTLSERMELVGDHTWRYHYYVAETNVGARLLFHFSGKEVFTNDVPFTFASRTNSWYSSDTDIEELPFTATLAGAAEAQLTLDGTGTHLLFEFNDEKQSFSVCHATYQDVNRWTDAREGYRGNAIATNEDAIVTNAGVSDKKTKFEPEIWNWKTCPFESVFWAEEFNTSDTNNYPLNKLFSNHPTPNGWSAVQAMFVPGARNSTENLAFQLAGGGSGALTMENFNASTVPPGVDTISFTARIAQQLKFSDFVYNMYATGLKNYGFSARMTMSRRYMDDNFNPPDLSPVYPSISLVGYYRPNQGCYEFRLTRTDDGGNRGITFGLYKWTSSDTSTSAQLIRSKFVKQGDIGHLFVPVKNEATNVTDTAAFNAAYGYITLRTTADNQVAIRCVVTKTRYAHSTALNSAGNFLDVFNEVIDSNPGVLRFGGAYGIGSIDCQAAFGNLMRHELLSTGAINTTGTSEYNDLESAGWGYYDSRWKRLAGAEINSANPSFGAGLKTLIPQNQTMKVYLADAANNNGKDANWVYSGYEVSVPSFSTNKFEVSPQMPGLWKVRLQTGGEASDDVITDVVVDDVRVTPWQGISVGEVYGENRADSYSNRDWAYTKAWIGTSADVTTADGKPFGGYELKSVGTNGFVFIFNKAAGRIKFVPKMDMVIDRILLVGGGGGGGSVMGGGGGGGGVLDLSFSTNAVTIPVGEEVGIIVGGGGNNPYAGQPAGATGGASSIDSAAINMLVNKAVNKAVSVAGGGGGSGWSASALSGATGGGGSNSRAGAAGSLGGKGGTATNGRGGGGGGAGGDGKDATLGFTSAAHTTAAAANTQNAYGANGGDGGDGKQSDITGVPVYYGGGGGGGAGWGAYNTYQNNGGLGGLGGGGRGSNTKEKDKSTQTAVDGQDGFGGGGGGGTWYDANDLVGNRGGKGGCGTVIIRCRNASKAVTLQPARASRDTSITDSDGQHPIPPQGIRSPFIDNGLSLFSFSYANADTNCVLLVQISTNMVTDSYVQDLTFSTATNNDDHVWTTVRRYDFSKDAELANGAARASGTLTTFLSLRKHVINGAEQKVRGVMRVIVDPDVVKKAVESTETKLADPTSARLRTTYGQITITQAYCYDEPPIDGRSWFGWNVHTEGWDSMKAGDYAYLTDWPDGLSLSLNYSSKDDENGGATGTGDAKGIPLGDREHLTEYAANNSFVQCPEMTNGIGSVSFRARLFDTNQTAAVISLYLGTDAGDNQTDEMAWQSWGNPVTNFVVTTPTYQTYSWKTTDDKNAYRTMRLEVAGSRHGRRPSESGVLKDWETVTPKVEPLQRVFIDEISVGEPVAPRLALRRCRPFRTNLGNEEICVITNIMHQDQQPILGESWGVQVEVEPQQMSDDLDMGSIKAYLSVLRGTADWGYSFWPKEPTTALIANRVELPRVESVSNLVFRSHYSVPASIMPPENEAKTYYQYKVWVEYYDKRQDKATEKPHVHTLDARDWKIPEWYNGAYDYNEYYGSVDGRFAAFTIMESMSPRRAWFNELEIYKGNPYSSGATDTQFIELAVPQGANLKDWKIEVVNSDAYKYTLAQFGQGGLYNLTEKYGSRPGQDYLKDEHYTFVALRSPKSSTLAGSTDGVWSSLKDTVKWEGFDREVGNILHVENGQFMGDQPYGLRLVRPSGIIEHEIVFEGKNIWEGWADEWKHSGTNTVVVLRNADGPRSMWTFVGADSPDGSLGVVKNHGEYGEFPNDPLLNEWHAGMVPTPGEINEGQDFPKGYYLESNGTNVWIYAYSLGKHVRQIVNGVANTTSVMIVPIGTTTGITYQVDNWYETANCKVNGESAPNGDGMRGPTCYLDLGSVEATTTVEMEDKEQSRLAGEYGIDADNVYYNGIMHWLTTNWPDKSSDDISLASFVALSGTTNRLLTLTEMYWLNIPPIDNEPAGSNKGENWVFKAGMGTTAPPHAGEPGGQGVKVVTATDEKGVTHRDLEVTVTMMISNKVTHAAHAPSVLQGVVPGLMSNTNNAPVGSWQGPTFKIKGALQANGVGDVYRPVREFTLCEKSFGKPYETSDFTTTVLIPDPQTRSSSPGYYYKWYEYPSASIFYMWGLDDQSLGYTTIEMLDESTRINRNPNP